MDHGFGGVFNETERARISSEISSAQDKDRADVVERQLVRLREENARLTKAVDAQASLYRFELSRAAAFVTAYKVATEENYKLLKEQLDEARAEVSRLEELILAWADNRGDHNESHVALLVVANRIRAQREEG